MPKYLCKEEFRKERGNVMETAEIRRLDMPYTAHTPFQAWMLERGIRQSWLAETTDFKQPLISKWATGKTLPDVNQARIVLRALQYVSSDVTLEDLWPLETENEG